MHFHLLLDSFWTCRNRLFSVPSRETFATALFAAPDSTRNVFCTVEEAVSHRELKSLSVRASLPNPAETRSSHACRTNDCRTGQAQADATAETSRVGGRSIRLQGLGAHARDVQPAEGPAEEGEGPQAGSEEPQAYVAGSGSHCARDHQGHVHHNQVLRMRVLRSQLFMRASTTS